MSEFICKFLLLVLFISQFTLIIAQDSKLDSFDHVQTKINELESSKNYYAAIEYINSIRDQFPENEFEVLLELAYCNLQLGNYDLSMNYWEEGHSKGYFFLIRSASPVYKDIKDDERFKKICDKDNELRQASLEKSETIYEVKLPETYSEDKQYPLMIILHGGGRSIHSPKPHWNSKILNENFIIVYIQSYLHYSSKTFGWAHNDLRAEEDIKNIFYKVADEYPVDTTKVFIGGISAGGMAAFDIGFTNPSISLKGIIGICPAIAGRFFTLDKMKNKRNRIECYHG